MSLRCSAALRSVVLPALLLAWGSDARAQAQGPQLATFNAQTFRPTLGVGNLFTVEGTLLPRPRWPIAGLVLEVANRPLRLVLQDTGETYAATVPVSFTAHLMAGAGITSWFAAALALPVVLYQGFDTRTPTSDVPNTPTLAGVGDLRLLTKFQLFQRSGFGLAAVPQLTFSTGSATSFRGDNTLGIEPRLAADYRFQSGVVIAANLGVYIRTYNHNVDFDLVRVSDHLRYGVGVGVPLPKGFAISGELTGGIGFSKFEGGPLYTPLEWYAGGRYAIKKGFEINAGVGGGFIGAVGSPSVRVFAGATYVLPGARGSGARPQSVAPRESQDDGAAAAGRVAGTAPDGCVDSAVARDRERCPDRDKDGVPDALDACPEKPGPAAQRGCPAAVADSDKDGVADSVDRCPSEPGPAANGGCPEPDQDKDGIADRLDKCPRQAGPRESAGCPLLTLEENSIRLALPLKFRPGSAELASESRPTVAALVTALRATPAIRKVLIDVTAGGSRHAARKLATRRAKALTDLLIESGATGQLLAIRAVSEPGPDQIARVDLVREASPSRPEPSGAARGASAPEKRAPDKPAPDRPDEVQAEPERARPARSHSAKSDSGDDDSDPAPRHHRSHRSHPGKDGKPKKSNKEKRGHH